MLRLCMAWWRPNDRSTLLSNDCCANFVHRTEGIPIRYSVCSNGAFCFSSLILCKYGGKGNPDRKEDPDAGKRGRLFPA